MDDNWNPQGREPERFAKFTPTQAAGAATLTADWSNRDTTTAAGWINELLTLAEHRNAALPTWARHAIRTIAYGLHDALASTATAPSVPTRAKLEEWQRDGTLIGRVIGTLAEQEREIIRLEAATSAPTDAKSAARLQWLHSEASCNVDGWEWGIFKVKWGHCEGEHQIRHTFADFSDLDDAMPLSTTMPDATSAQDSAAPSSLVDAAYQRHIAKAMPPMGGAGRSWWHFSAGYAAALASAAPSSVSAGEYFAYSPDTGLDWHGTESAARAAAQAEVDFYRREANKDGEWCESVEGIRWGVVLGKSVSVPHHGEKNDAGEGSFDYVLTPPAPAAAPQAGEPVTPALINALPQPLRGYIHELETRADPAGTVRELVQLRDTNAGLQKMYRCAAEALAETTDERLKDLVERRLMHAQYAAAAILAQPQPGTGSGS